jgi:hypothetical protein
MQLTEEQIEKMRAIGLRLDRSGTFWQEGAPVTHQRLRQALLRWLDVRAADGRDIVKLDGPGSPRAGSAAEGQRGSIDERRYAYVDVEDAHLRARSARWDGDRAWIVWDDDMEGTDPEELAYATLRQAPDHALYATARGRLRGRIAGPAYLALTEHVAPDGAGFVLAAAGKQWPIRAAA